jgi:hypothetical protein
VDTALHGVRVVRGEIMTSILEAHVPSGLDTLPPDQIAELRAEMATGRLRYHRDVQGVVQEFAGVASEGELSTVKQRIVSIATERVDDVKQTYRRARLDTIVKAIGIPVVPPAMAASIASALGIGIFAPAGVVAALAAVGAARLLELEKAKADKAKSAWSYVLDVWRRSDID